MEQYLFYSILSLGISLFIYKVFLKKEKNFLFNRFYLLATLLLCLIAPTLDLDFSSAYVPRETMELIPKLVFPEAEEDPIIQSVELVHKASFPWNEILILIYLLGVTFLLIRFFRNLLKMYCLIKNNTHVSQGSLKLIMNGEKGNPYSFFHYIFINEQDLLNNHYMRSVLAHEHAHSKQYHSADIIYLELISCFFWFNPFIWFYKREVLENHEFLADMAVINTGVDINAYSSQLIKGNQIHTQPLMSGFSFIKTKNRLTMLHSKKSSRTVRNLKIVIALSLFAGLFAFSSFSPKAATETFVVLVDPGHGGRDSGSLNEKEINLQVALRLSELSKEEDIKIVLVRNTDQFVDLASRVNLIETHKANLFLSLHSTVSTDPNQRGVKAFFAPDGLHPEKSSEFSKIFVSEQLGQITDKGEVNGSNFFILKNSSVPAVLLELGYLSNSMDNRRLNDQNHQKELATSLYSALQKIKKASRN